MPAQTNARISCREIRVDDLDAIADLLNEGFPKTNNAYWRDGLQRLAHHTPPGGVPKFGYLLACGELPVGALLLICSDSNRESQLGIRCNVSSWFVRPEFRVYAPLLVLRAIKNDELTYVNIWPAQHTLGIIEAQGFTKAGEGYFVGAPALRPQRLNAKISWRPEQWGRMATVADWEKRMLIDHRRFGCLCFWCEADGLEQPFIFRRRYTRLGHVPHALLIYSRSLEGLEKFAGPIGRFLAFRGMPMLIASSRRPLRGIIGKYFPTKLPIYCKGPLMPNAGDLSYTDAALFGI